MISNDQKERLSPIIIKLIKIKTNINNRAKKRGQFDNITVEDLIFLVKSQNGKCFYCKKDVKMYEDNRKYSDALSFDHKLSMGLGGTNTLNNIVMCCKECNQKRNTADQKKYPHYFNIYNVKATKIKN
ncbi:MAG: HNH endonuclease [Paludibacter sp.]|nr:HNH endonuclease [Paludibacter sp.]